MITVIAVAGCTSKDGKTITAKVVDKEGFRQLSNEEGLTETQVGPQTFCMQGKITLDKDSNVTASSSDGRIKLTIEPTKTLSSASKKGDNFRVWLHKEAGIGNSNTYYGFISYPNSEDYGYTQFSPQSEGVTDEMIILREKPATDLIVQITYKDTKRKGNDSIPPDPLYSTDNPFKPVESATPINPAAPSAPVAVAPLFH
jgi:hypothetical protein